MGRTAGAKNKPKNFDEEGFDVNNTEINTENVSRETRGRTKTTNVQKEIVADKLNLLCEGIAGMFGYEYKFTPEDYKKEALALTNLSKQYNFLGKALEVLDPLLIIFGIWSKFRHMPKKSKPNKEQKQQPVNNPVNYTQDTQSNNPSTNLMPFLARG